MTFLSANEIRDEIEAGRLRIEPFEPNLIKPASIVLRFGDRWRGWRDSEFPINVWSLNAGKDNLEDIETRDSYQLRSSRLIVNTTLEKISLPTNLLGIISTLSHLARFGLSIHLGSFIVNPGFGSDIPTELALELTSFNPAPILIQAGVPACHLAFARITDSDLATHFDYPLRKSIYEARDALEGPALYEEYSSLLESKE